MKAATCFLLNAILMYVVLTLPGSGSQRALPSAHLSHRAAVVINCAVLRRFTGIVPAVKEQLCGPAPQPPPWSAMGKQMDERQRVHALEIVAAYSY